MKHLLPLALAALGLCQAEDFTLADGSVLHDARVVRQDSESAVISHSTGVQRVPFTHLTPELQQRFDLTPEAVAARREKAEQAEKQRTLAQEKKAAMQREALLASGLSPRYMTGADVISLYSAWSTLSASAAEYMAAEWNRREALRCGLTIEAQRFKEDATQLSARVAEERAEANQSLERIASLEQQLLQKQRELLSAQAKLEQAEKKQRELEEQPAQKSTVVITEPKLVPVYRPVVLPPQPRPPLVRPTPAPRPAPVRPVSPARPLPR